MVIESLLVGDIKKATAGVFISKIDI